MPANPNNVFDPFLAINQLSGGTTNNEAALLALAGAINDSRPRPRFEEAMRIYNRDWADKIDAPKALDKWEASETACLRFILTRPQDREQYFEALGHRTFQRIQREREDAKKPVAGAGAFPQGGYMGGLFLDSRPR